MRKDVHRRITIMYSYPTDKELEEIRTRWFPHHKAKIQEFEPNFFRLRWANPATSDYAITYIVDGYNLCVMGDLGEAIYCWSGRINLHFLRSLELGYFHGKCQASEKGRMSENYDFSFEKFKAGLFQQIKESREGGSFRYEKLNLEYFGLIDEDEYGAIAWLRKQDIDGEEAGSFLRNGKTIPLRCASHLIGLQMAADQLDSEKNSFNANPIAIQVIPTGYIHDPQDPSKPFLIKADDGSYLPCEGTDIDRVKFPVLWEICKEYYHKTPDFRGRVTAIKS